MGDCSSLGVSSLGGKLETAQSFLPAGHRSFESHQHHQPAPWPLQIRETIPGVNTAGLPPTPSNLSRTSLHSWCSFTAVPRA